MDATSALLLDPNHVRAREVRAQARVERGHFNEAISDIDEALASPGSSRNLLLYRAKALLGLNRLGEALTDLETLLADRALAQTGWPLYTEAQLLHAQLLRKHRRSGEALAEVQELFADRRNTLRLQLHLREQGYRSVEISGEYTNATERALVACLRRSKCNLGQGPS